MINQDEIKKTVKEFIYQNFIFDSSKTLPDDESLLGSGTIDSTGILELIGFLEEKFNITFMDSELVGENFDTLIKITAFLQKKLNNS
jgi:acyl carrier protein